eukprot:3176245-Amphidinium_carterae.1
MPPRRGTQKQEQQLQNNRPDSIALNTSIANETNTTGPQGWLLECSDPGKADEVPLDTAKHQHRKALPGHSESVVVGCSVEAQAALLHICSVSTIAQSLETGAWVATGDSNETGSPFVECPSSVDPVDSIDTPNCELRVYSDSFCSEEVSIALGIPACDDLSDENSTELPILSVRDGYLQFFASDLCAAVTVADVKCVRMFLPQDWLRVSDDLLLHRMAVEQGESWSYTANGVDTANNTAVATTITAAHEWNLASQFVARWMRKSGGGLPELVIYRASSTGVPVWAGALLCMAFVVLLWILLCGLAPAGFFCRALPTHSEPLPLDSFTGQRPGVRPSRPESVSFPDPRSRGARMEEVVAFSAPGSKALSELCCADFLSASYPLGPEVLRVEQLQHGQPQYFICTSARDALSVVLSWAGPSTLRLLSPVKHEENFKVQRCGGDDVWDAGMAVLRAKFSRGSRCEELLMRT